MIILTFAGAIGVFLAGVSTGVFGVLAYQKRRRQRRAKAG